MNTSNAPQGTFLHGTKVQVGGQRVIIEKYLSEGGFAHVYVVRVPRDNNKYELAVLKRVAVPDREHLANTRGHQPTAAETAAEFVDRARRAVVEIRRSRRRGGHA